jgi:hypothetical protein
MSTLPTLVNFPVTPLQKDIPLMQTMASEIEKSAVTMENLCAALHAAGYETQLNGDEISVLRAGCFLSVKNYPEFSKLSIRAQMQVNEKISDGELNQLLADLNKNAFHLKISAFRWDDGCVALFFSHVVFYPFGLNLANFIFALRRVAEGTHTLLEGSIRGTRFEVVMAEDAE